MTLQSQSLAIRWHRRLKQIFYKESVFTAVRGMAETGKTNLVFLWMELTWALGMFTHYCGNVPIQGNAFPYELMRDLESLKLYCRSLPKGSRIFFFFDEAGKNAPKGTPWGKLNIALLSSLQVLRKYHLTLVVAFIGDSVSDLILSPVFLNGGWFDKQSKTRAVWHSYRLRKLVTIRHIPKSSIEYDEFADVSFFATPQAQDDSITKRPASVNRFLDTVKGMNEGRTLAAQGIHHNTFQQDYKKIPDYIYYLESVIQSRHLRGFMPSETSDPQA